MKKIVLIALLSTSYSFSQCFVKIASGEQHTIAIADDGTLWGWGSNSSGEAGISANYPNHVNVPTQIGTANNWTDIDCGSYHSMALNANNELYTWGYNVYGQLGLGDYSTHNSPSLVVGYWKAIGAGAYHSLAVSLSGELYAAGAGDSGQLGDNLVQEHNAFENVASGSDWKDATGGQAFSIALKNDGTLYASGYNGDGQFGDGSTASSNFWVSTTAVSNWDRIDAGFNYVFGLTDAGALYSWGDNSYGQLGLNGTVQQIDPQSVSTNITDFACGYNAAIWTTGTSVYTAGSNAYYQSQSGTTNDVTTPYQWPQLNNPELVTMGIFSSTVVTSTGLATWGRNDRGICGNGNFNNVTTPTYALSCGAAGIQSATSEGLAVFPNPAQDHITVELSSPGALIVSDMNGKQLLTSESSQLHHLNTGHLERGVYFITTENGATSRFIKN